MICIDVVERAKGFESTAIDEVVVAEFARKGRAMCVYWLPPGPEMERPDEQLTLTVTTRPDTRLDEPVLVDPLDATIYQPRAAEHAGDRWVFEGLRLADHPLIVMDRSLVL